MGRPLETAGLIWFAPCREAEQRAIRDSAARDLHASWWFLSLLSALSHVVLIALIIALEAGGVFTASLSLQSRQAVIQRFPLAARRPLVDP
jgi:hypothetical protein